jgi:parvulin-like peptidyl-prolyl isomerase
MVKRRSIFILISILGTALWAQTAQSDPIDRPVAIIKLYESEAITQSQFKNTVKAMEKTINRSITMDEKKQLLDNLINERLIVQAANKDKFTVTDAEINKYIDQTKKAYEQKLGRPMTDDEFKGMVTQTGYTWDMFNNEIKKVLLEQKYIQAKKGNILSNVPEPTDKEIMDYFYKYQSRFVSPEMVRYKQIFINPNQLSTPAEKESAKKKAQAIGREIKAGASFDNYWEVYDETGRIKIGSLINDTLRRDDEQKTGLYGDSFINAVFALKQGEVSDVISSKLGYHIVVVLERYPFKVLGIDELIPPQNTMTVRNYIKTLLSQMKEQEVMQKALEELVAELRKTADIQYFFDYLNW